MRLNRLLAVCLGVIAVGCDDSVDVRVQTIEPTDRSLIAYASSDTQFVQVSLKGPRRYVDEREPAFAAVVESLDLSKRPVGVKIPDGFRQDEAATADVSRLVPETGEPIAIEVLSIPQSPRLSLDEPSLRILVNRTRKELDLPVWLADEWPEAAEAAGELTRSGDGDNARLQVDLVGFSSPDGLKSVILPAKISTTPPEGWDNLGADQFRLQRFERTIDGATVSLSLSRAKGTVLANVNRWRGQVGMEPIESDDELTPRTVDGEDGFDVTLYGETTAIRGVVVDLGDDLVFVKMNGPTDAVRAAESTFQTFVESVDLG